MFFNHDMFDPDTYIGTKYMMSRGILKEPVNKDIKLLETEKWIHDPQTQCAHVSDLFNKREIAFDDELTVDRKGYVKRLRMDGQKG